MVFGRRGLKQPTELMVVVDLAAAAAAAAEDKPVRFVIMVQEMGVQVEAAVARAAKQELADMVAVVPSVCI